MIPILLQGDCLDVMKGLDAGSVSCVIADPPYGTTSLDWDHVDNRWLEEAARISSQLWCFGPMRFWVVHGQRFRAVGWKYAQEIVWEKQNGSSFHADRFRRVHEIVTHWYRGRWSDLYLEPQYTLDARPRTVRRKERPPHMGEIKNSTYVSVDGGPRLVRSVLRIRNEHRRAVHPTQKPVELLSHLVRYSAPTGGLVFDPFAGSASVGVACREADRRYLGVEIDEARWRVGMDRLLSPVSEATAI